MTKKLWGGRFAKKTDPLVEDFTRSVHYDYKLGKFDILGSIAHVQVLKKAGYLTRNEASRLSKALKALGGKFEDPAFKPDFNDEDIHTYIQNELEKKVGPAAFKLHTARSRNDQVVVAMKMYSKEKIPELKKAVDGVASALAGLAERNKSIIIPGFTHMQHAQPVYLKDYLAAYVSMFERDAKRFDRITGDLKITMGAGALAGTPISAEDYKTDVTEAAANSIDAVSDRDFVIEILSAIAVMGMHLSRLSEDLIIWSSPEFGFVEIGEAFSTGSSLMPQKKNPDVLELVRGYAGRLCGNLVSVLVMMKALPLAYNRDMQLDKEPLFDSIETASGELLVLAGLVKDLAFNKAAIAKALDDESLYATDMVYYLVGKGVPFKDAHDIVGRLVRYSVDNGIEIKSLTDGELKKFSDKFKRVDILKLFNPVVSVRSKKSIKRR
jgi:argininosuccinate lyase